jgi:hypothetical protein
MQLKELVAEAEIRQDANADLVCELTNLELAIVGGGSGDVVVC